MRHTPAEKGLTFPSIMIPNYSSKGGEHQPKRVSFIVSIFLSIMIPNYSSKGGEHQPKRVSLIVSIFLFLIIPQTLLSIKLLLSACNIPNYSSKGGKHQLKCVSFSILINYTNTSFNNFIL